MLAWLAETRAAHEHRADAKFAIDEMIQWNTGRGDVAASVRGGDLDSESLPGGVAHALEERCDGLDLDQRDFAPAIARCLRVVPDPGEIPISLKPASRKSPHFGD